MNFNHYSHQKLSQKLVLDELFAFLLFQRMAAWVERDTQLAIEKLIPFEKKHVEFWNEFFGTNYRELDFIRKTKLWFLIWAVRIFGDIAANLILEAIEAYNSRKYLAIWKVHQKDSWGKIAREILRDEFLHEGQIISGIISRKKINPERIRNIFLGINDGLVEMLGAISGFFATFHSVSSVLMAGLTVAVAGSISMAAGVLAAESSEREVRHIEKEKNIFLGIRSDRENEIGEKPWMSGIIVGIAYFIGAMIPVLPVALGVASVLTALAAAVIITLIISSALAFFSGMEVKKRLVINFVIITAALGLTYVIGTLARYMLGIDI